MKTIKCKKKRRVQIKLSKVQTCTTGLASCSLTQWRFWQLTLKWLSGACAQDKTNFFLIFIQLCDSRKIHYLTREFCVKLHLYREPILLLVYDISSGGRIKSFFLIGLSHSCYAQFPVIIFRFAVINSDFHRGDEKILNLQLSVNIVKTVIGRIKSRAVFSTIPRIGSTRSSHHYEVFVNSFLPYPDRNFYVDWKSFPCEAMGQVRRVQASLLTAGDGHAAFEFLHHIGSKARPI